MKEVLVVALEVLIADEDQYVAVNLKHILEEVDNVKVVAIANDGKNAVSLVEKLRPQVVCLDIDIPEMNGIELIFIGMPVQQPKNTVRKTTWLQAQTLPDS